MNLNIPQYDFYKHKYGDELLIDVVPLNTIKKYLKEQPVHILTYYDITLITSGEGEFLIDHQANRVKPQDIIFTRPGEIRKWDDKTIQDGFALIFEEEFLLSFFNDPAFLRNLSYFHTERRSSKLSLDKKAYGRISELISEIDKEIKDYQSKDKHLLRALLYETLMLLDSVLQQKPASVTGSPFSCRTSPDTVTELAVDFNISSVLTDGFLAFRMPPSISGSFTHPAINKAANRIEKSEYICFINNQY